jgi:S-DNA-T family DNA segregation ATPase FtsK/SpoIIIE
VDVPSSKPRRKTTSTKPRRRGAESPWAKIKRLLMQRELWGLFVCALSVAALMALLLPEQGKLGEAWSRALRQIMGVGAYVVVLLCVAGGVVVLFWERIVSARTQVGWHTVVGAELLIFGGLGFLHLVAAADLARASELASAGRWGGHVGWAWYRLLVPAFGRTLSALLTLAVAGWGLALLVELSWGDAVWGVRWAWAWCGLTIRRTLERMATKRAVPIAEPAAEPEGIRINLPAYATLKDEDEPTEGSHAQARSEPTPRPRPPKSAEGLPSLDLLERDSEATGDDADTRHRAQVIEETLASFGVPAKVVEWNRGPVVTQFGVEPGFIEYPDREGEARRQKVRVSKISALSNDLALALAAAPIRIEAPVPGRSVVGIEVPNGQKTLVGLRDVMESKAFRRQRGKLRIALGRDVSGEAVVANLEDMPHLLVAGATGSGKSVCLNSIIASLLLTCQPDELRMLLVDPKRVELTNYNGIPHLVAPVVVDVQKVVAALRWVVREMDGRYAKFAEAGVRNLAAFNKKANSRGEEPLPMVVVVVDELADLMLSAGDSVEALLCRIAQMARATGIHLVVATQRPSVDVITGLIKANFPARIAFAVSSQVDSRVILDAPGAEKLLGQGDMLYMAPDTSKLLRVQGCFVSDRELEALVRFWKVQSATEAVAAPEPPPWEGLEESVDDDDDALLQEAVDLVRQHGQASASFLQRQLRVGYPRAARLIDELEELGVVGPPQAGGRSRDVLVTEEDAEQELPDATEAEGDPDLADEVGDDA